jgi:hypothetical protein
MNNLDTRRRACTITRKRRCVDCPQFPHGRPTFPTPNCGYFRVAGDPLATQESVSVDRKPLDERVGDYAHIEDARHGTSELPTMRKLS